MSNPVSSKLMVRALPVVVSLVMGTALVLGVGGRASAGVLRATAPSAAITCPTDYNGASPPCTSATYILDLTVSAHVVDSTTVQIDWKACIIPAADATAASVQFYVDGTAYTGPGGTGTVLTDGSGCTTDPQYSGCLASGQHTAVASIAGFGDTNVVDFTVPAGVSCPTSGSPAAISTAASTSSAASSGSLAFTGAPIFRAVLFAVLLLLLGAVITYVARDRRRKGTSEGPMV